ncbi:hypothetical protein IFM89_020395 [Coptis chinensis]|uniref:Uncharacterized protein n=1 Tax=Coptis chinensis TaxID=261450 RepID=A0A835M9H6_9MAGN|nr:hypothetical protein IFM89_020395 [Coptis chinensis]
MPSRTIKPYNSPALEQSVSSDQRVEKTLVILVIVVAFVFYAIVLSIKYIRYRRWRINNPDMVTGMWTPRTLPISRWSNFTRRQDRQARINRSELVIELLQNSQLSGSLSNTVPDPSAECAICLDILTEEKWTLQNANTNFISNVFVVG